MDINRLRAVVYRHVVRTVYITRCLQDMDINRLRAVVYRHVVRTVYITHVYRTWTLTV